MSDLIAFLLARLEDDEATAKACTEFDPVACEDVKGLHMTTVRAKREIEAKRLIVARCDSILAAFRDPASGLWPDVSRRERHHANAILDDLAAIYSDHTDYREEWKRSG